MLRIDPAKRTVERDGEPIKLTFFEFEILFALARQPGRVFTRAELLEHVLGDSEYRDQRTIDVHIRHLREKLEADPANPQLILTERRVGYRFQEM
jgi:DNA-binding response OmpR family regulator